MLRIPAAVAALTVGELNTLADGRLVNCTGSANEFEEDAASGSGDSGFRSS